MTREEHTDALLERLHDVRTREDLADVYVAWTSYHVDQREDYAMACVFVAACNAFEGASGDYLFSLPNLGRIAKEAGKSGDGRVGDAILTVLTMDKSEVARLRLDARMLVLERLSLLYDYKPTTWELHTLRVDYHIVQQTEKEATSHDH